MNIEIARADLTECLEPFSPLIDCLGHEAHRVELQGLIHWVEVELLRVTL